MAKLSNTWYEFIVNSTMVTYVGATWCYILNLASIPLTGFWDKISSAANLGIEDADTGITRPRVIKYLDIPNKKGLVYFDAPISTSKKFRLYYGPSVSQVDSTTAVTNDNFSCYLPMSETSGTSVADLTTAYTCTTLGGCATNRDGKIYKSINFPGSNALTVCNNQVIGTGNTTVGLILYNDTTVGTYPTVMFNGKFYIFRNGTTYGLSNTGGGSAIQSAAGSYSTGDYVHLLVTRKSDGKTTFYINGAQSGGLDQTTASPVSGTINLTFGSTTPSLSGANHIDGSMENFFCTSDIKDPTWIATNYQMSFNNATFFTNFVSKSAVKQNKIFVGLSLP